MTIVYIIYIDISIYDYIFLPGVYARGSKIPHSGYINVTCSGIIHSSISWHWRVVRTTDYGRRCCKTHSTFLLKGIGTSQTSKYVFGVFAYLSYRFHTHMNNRGAYYYRFDKILHLIQRAEASRGNVFYNELGDHVSRVEVYVLPAIGITC